MQDTGHHRHRLERRLRESPEFRVEFERRQREVAETDSLQEWLDKSATWGPVGVAESPADALAAERDRRDG